MNRNATTLIETILVIAILVVLFGLLLPAVQQVRESARRISCQNNLRNIALASLNLEATVGHLPGPTMNAHPRTGQYRADSGLFVNLLPYLEQNELHGKFSPGTPCSAPVNSELLVLRPAIFKCPSTGESMELTNMAGSFSGSANSELIGIACDYVGNDGCFVGKKPLFGTVRLRVGNVVQEYKMRDMVDGTSNTLLYWESRGDYLVSGGKRGSADVSGLTSFVYMIDQNPANNISSNTLASYKSYLLAWTGFRVGAIVDNGAKTVNGTNLAGEPFSSHDVLPCAMTDGRVTVIAINVDPTVLLALSTSQNGEPIQDLVQ